MKKDTALLLIDVQQGFEQTDYWGGHRNNPEAELRMADLLACWRHQGLPVIHVKHNSSNPLSPLRPGQPGNQIKAEVAPLAGETLFSKRVNSAFIGTALQTHLHRLDIQHLLVVGFITDHCISTSVRMGANLGFTITVVEDATATFDRVYQGKTYRAEDIHQYHLLSLQDEFAQVADSRSIIRQFQTKSAH